MLLSMNRLFTDCLKEISAMPCKENNRCKEWIFTVLFSMSGNVEEGNTSCHFLNENVSWMFESDNSIFNDYLIKYLRCMNIGGMLICLKK